MTPSSDHNLQFLITEKRQRKDKLEKPDWSLFHENLEKVLNLSSAQSLYPVILNPQTVSDMMTGAKD